MNKILKKYNLVYIKNNKCRHSSVGLEYMTVNHEVAGSNPAVGAIINAMHSLIKTD